MAGRGAWTVLRRLTLAGTALLAVVWIARPHLAATVLWWGVVPLLPALFLVHPALWRNICPLATLSMGRSGVDSSGAAKNAGVRAGAAGVLPLLVLVAWRGTGLEARPAEAGVILAGVFGVAVVTGRRGIRRNGFCNRLCPLLPVERLYGQRPLVQVADDRCPTCTLCTPRGCLDLSPTAATAQLLGPGRRDARWLRTPFGGFAAAFPGFVAAWFLLSPGSEPADGPMLAVGLLAGLLASWGLATVVVRAAGLSWRSALPTMAALAAGLYYGFALPRAAEAWGLGGVVGHALQAAALVGVLAWWVRALFTDARTPGARPGRPA